MARAIRILGIFSFLLWAKLLGAQLRYQFNGKCLEAYQAVTKLQWVPAKESLALLHKNEPQNAVPVLLENYLDFFQLFINEDPQDHARLYPHFQERLDLLSKADPASPFYRYGLAVVRTHRAIVQVKFNHYWEAARDLRKAYLLLAENQELYPQFAPNNMLFAALQTVIGTLPPSYKWMVKLLGMRGDLNGGLERIQQVANSKDPWAKIFFPETAFIYPYLLFHLANRPDEALAFVRNNQLDLVNNHLHAYMAANLFLNHKEAAKSRSIIENRNRSADYMPLVVWDFTLGYAHLYHLEYAAALQHYEAFLRSFKGKFYVKEVYQRMAWAHYLMGQEQKAQASIASLLKAGSTQSDADKKAHREALSGQWPNPLLLKARLLNDGGYNSEAYAVLAGKTEDDFNTEVDKLEFAYRAARIQEDLGKTEDAIRNYKIAIRKGQDRPEHFAARSALHLGMIYEARGQKAMAKTYYRLCLDMDDHDYKDSLDQKAKAGIARCAGE